VFHGNVHRHLLILSLANWAIAIVCWMVSAYLGIASPTGIFVYTTLFVIGLFAVIVAVGAYVLSRFGAEPVAAVAEAAGPAVESGDGGDPPATGA
jgi:hypothetical protein